MDLAEDSAKENSLLSWADSVQLAPYVPAAPTSLRSSRTIDFALASGLPVSIQTYEGGTTSDHKPIISSVPWETSETKYARNVHWKVFSLFCEFVYSYWENRWHMNCLNEVYDDYVSFMSLLTDRCTSLFPLNKYQIALPRELRAFMSHTRALSFKQKRNKDTDLKNTVRLRRRYAKNELKLFLLNRFTSSVTARNCPSPSSVSFWSRTKKYMKNSSPQLSGFLLHDGQVVRDPVSMCAAAASYYEEFFKEPIVTRPHPYVDGPEVEWDNYHEDIPKATYEEVVRIVHYVKKKKSCDANGLSSFMFSSLPLKHWSLLLKIFNHSLETGEVPLKWKDTRMIILARKQSLCDPSATRPISLLDVFSKVNEKLFLERFTKVVKRRGLLPDSQSGFRGKFRLQTRVLLFLEEVSSLMSNSSPVSTLFIDFKSAFDALWYIGCIGKLKRMGIFKNYLRWIQEWLSNRRAFIEISGHRSKWFPILKGGPQGSCFTPQLFICYHADLCDFFQFCSSFCFADDLAAVLAGRIGTKYSEQCLDLER